MTVSASYLSLFALLITVCHSQLAWKFTSNPAAVCNDFSRTGFFYRNVSRDSSEKKWILFLESGSLCYSNATCNQRYFQPHLREKYSIDQFGAYGNFNTKYAWEDTRGTGTRFTRVVNPLMTSLYCFAAESHLFSSDFTIIGKDILSQNCDENPTFCKHGHVLLPYCSSDLWLGDENATSRQYSSKNTSNAEPCECWDEKCFMYNPTSEDLQFTFRGKSIFRSVLQTLDDLYDLQTATEIVLVGSSAGGLGVLNLAGWVREQYPSVRVMTVVDSAWFINFHNGINAEFGSIMATTDNENVLLSLLASHDACNDTRLGYPCCLSAECLLTLINPVTGDLYYPQDVPLFVITSLYDVFVLARTLVELSTLQSEDYSAAGLSVLLVSTIGEYGGAMNASLIKTVTVAEAHVSVYVSQCFQHIYFASSTLWGQEDETLMGSNPVEVTSDVASFR